MTNLARTLAKLCPPGSIPEEDTKTYALLACLASEFEKGLQVLVKVIDSIPDSGDGILANRWRQITDSNNPASRLASKGYACQYKGSKYYVSNTKEHFESITKGVKVVAKENHITISGVRNIRTSIRCGFRAKEPIATFDRDEGVIDAYERMRHAHVLVTYEETK
jgi:hypothetical protein